MGLGENWYHLGNKICYIQKVSNFSVKKDIFVDRLESVIFGFQMYILQT